MSTAVSSTTLSTRAESATSHDMATGLRQRLARDVWTVGAATMLGQVVGVATSVSLRWLLSPTELGVWQSLRMFLSYGNYTGLGASKGAARELSVSLGKRETADGSSIAHTLNLAHTVNTLTSVLYGVALAGVAIWWSFTSSGGLSHAWVAGWLFLALFVVLQRATSFHITLLRAEQRFGVTSWQGLAEGVLTLALGAMAAWLAGLPGLYAATLLIGLASLVYLRHVATHRLRFAWDTVEIRRLVAIGGPILLVGLFTTLLRSLDRLTLLTFSTQPEFDVGCYSTALLIGSQLHGLASVGGTVTSPKLAQLHGSNNSSTAVARFAAETSIVQTSWMSLFASLAVIVGPSALAMLFPGYESALVAIPSVACSTVAGVVALQGSNTLIATGRERAALAALVIATIVSGLLLVVVGCTTPTLAAVSMTAMVGNFVYAAIAAGWGILAGLSRKEVIATVAAHLAAIAPLALATTLMLIYSPAHGATSQHSALTLMAQLLLVSIVWYIMRGVSRKSFAIVTSPEVVHS